MIILEELVEDSEKIGRFIFSEDHFNSSGRVYPAAFLPAKDGMASVYRIDGLSEEEITQIDREFVSGLRGKASKARADVFASNIRSVGLDVISAPIPHVRHADIRGFSSEKSEQKLKAMELAKYANLIRHK
jgi:hypothetical protein